MERSNPNNQNQDSARGRRICTGLRTLFVLPVGFVFGLASLALAPTALADEQASLPQPGLIAIPSPTSIQVQTGAEKKTDAPLNLATPGQLAQLREWAQEVDSTAGIQAGSTAARYNLNVSHLQRYQVDQGTRMTGWRLGDGVFFGRSKGELSGVALIWQRSQTAQVSLSGNGLRLTRRIN